MRVTFNRPTILRLPQAQHKRKIAAIVFRYKQPQNFEKTPYYLKLEREHLFKPFAYGQNAYSLDLNNDNRSKVRKVNKSKVQNKAYALFNSRLGKNKIKMFTVTFPQGFTDRQAFKCFNTWFTRIRKDFNFTVYIWVAERQLNGTLHYHVITPHYLKISTINDFMATTIANELKRDNTALKSFLKDRYNGIDVSKTKRHGNTLSRKQLVRYITKYVTKNDTQMEHHNVWHCSRLVSQLFTSICVDVATITELKSYDPNTKVFYTSNDPDLYLFVTYPTPELKQLFSDMLYSINEHVINSFKN